MALALSPNRCSWLAWILCAGLATWVIIAPRLDAYKNFLEDSDIYVGDARQQLTPYITEHADQDYASQYYRRVFMPLGVDTLYHALSKFYDVNIASRYVGFALLFTTFIFAGLAAGNLCGRWAGLAAMCYIMSATSVQELTQQGIPRSFAPACMAICIWAASLKNWRLMAACTVISALFYPIIAVISGLWLTINLCLYSGLAWRKKSSPVSLQPFKLLILTAVLSIAALLPAAIHVQDYGKPITRNEIKNYPEADQFGRYQTNNDGVWGQSFLYTLQQNLMYNALVGYRSPFFPSFYIRNVWETPDRLPLLLSAFSVMIMGVAIHYWQKRRDVLYIIGSSLAACMTGYVFSRLLMPYGFLPDRYIVYPMVVMIPITLACALEGFCSLLPLHKYQVARHILHIFILSLPVVLLGASGVGKFHGETTIGTDIHKLFINKELVKVLQNLPDTTVIAGWPDDTMDDIAYNIHHRVYLHYETHQAWHTGYVDKMRQRMVLLIQIFFDPDMSSIDRLRADGVTHVLIPISRYNKNKPLYYFEPFSSYIRSRGNDWDKKSAAILKLPKSQILYEDDSWRLVKLAP